MAQDLFPPASSSGGLTNAELRASAVTVTGSGGTFPVTDSGGSLTVDDGGGSLTVDATSLPLPTGAATAAKQPALGTAGTPSADVISVQGVSGGTNLPVTFSGDVTVVGKAAEGAPAAGNPLLLGGRYSLTAVTPVDDGDAVPLQCTAQGHLIASVTGAVSVSGTVFAVPVGTTAVGGPAAHNATVAGNPVLIGGYASTATPSAVTADGDMVRAWFDRNGRLQVGADTELPAAASLADGASNPTAPMVGANALLWNGSTWDRRQGKETGTLITLGNYTATQNLIGSAVTSRTARGAIIYVYVETPGTSTLQLNLCAMDPVGFGAVVGAVNVTAAAALYLASWCPGASGTGLGVLLTVAHPLPRRWYLVLNKGDASTWRYAVHYELVP